MCAFQVRNRNCVLDIGYEYGTESATNDLAAPQLAAMWAAGRIRAREDVTTPTHTVSIAGLLCADDKVHPRPEYAAHEQHSVNACIKDLREYIKDCTVRLQSVRGERSTRRPTGYGLATTVASRSARPTMVKDSVAINVHWPNAVGEYLVPKPERRN
ncbi:hypothetical protein VTO73DRAFT_4006 [Trametes versicolor]